MEIRKVVPAHDTRIEDSGLGEFSGFGERTRYAQRTGAELGITTILERLD